MNQSEREKLYCDDCGQEVLAVRDGDKLIITARRHSEKHILVLSIANIAQVLDRSLKAVIS